MSTLENLFMQIFDRKKWIVDQLNQQQLFYDQSLASSLLINGLRPPQWLLPPRSDPGNFDPQGLKKEELISGILFPHPHVTSSVAPPCTLYNKPVAKADNGQVSDSFFTETCASNKYFNPGDRSVSQAKGDLNDCELGPKSTKNEPSKPDPFPASPQVQIDEHANSNFEYDQSLSRIRRSRSRQKALELRNSAKAKAKPSNKENVTNECTGRIKRSGTAPQQPNCIKDILKHQNSLDIPHGCNGRVRQSRSVTSSSSSPCPIYLGSRSTKRLLNCVDKSLKPQKSLSRVEGDDIHLVATELVSNMPHESLSVHCGLTIGHDSHRVELENVVLGSPDNDAFIQPKQLVFDNMEECGLNHTTSPFEKEMRESLLEMRAIDKLEPVQSLKEGTICKDFQEKHHSSALEQPSVHCGLTIGRDSHRVELQNVVLGSPDNDAFIQPKQLVFENMEECGLNHTTSPFEKEMRESSLEIRSIDKLEPVQLLKEGTTCKDFQEKHHSPALEQPWEKEVLRTAEIESREEEALRASKEGKTRESFELVETEEPQHNSYPLSSGCGPSNMHVPLLKNGTSCDDPLANTSPLSNGMPNQSQIPIQLITTLQTFSNRSSLGSQLQRAADCEHASDTIVDPLKSTSPDFNNPNVSSRFGKTEGVQETMLCGINYSSSKTSSLRQPITQKVAQIHNSGCEARYFLRSSAIHDNDFGSSKMSRDSMKIIDNASEKLEMLLESQETTLGVVAPGAAKSSVLGQSITPKARQFFDLGRNVRYFLRSSTGHDKGVGASKSSGSCSAWKSSDSANNISNAAYGITWPNHKRRKITDHSDSNYTASLRVRRLQPLLQIHEDNNYKHLDRSGDVSDAPIVFQHFPVSHNVEVEQVNEVIDSPVRDLHRNKKCQKSEGSKSLENLPLSCLPKEVDLDMKGKDQCRANPLVCGHAHVESSISMKNQPDEDSQDFSKDDVVMKEFPNVIFDVKSPSEQWNPIISEDDLHLPCLGSKFQHETPEFSAYAEGTTVDKPAYQDEHSLFSYYSVNSKNYENANPVIAEKTMSEFEGFRVGEPTGHSLPLIRGSGISFDDGEFSSITKEQVSILEKLSRSTSILTPLPHPSTKYKIHTTPVVYQSLPNGLLENMDLRNALLYNGDEYGQYKDGKLTDAYFKLSTEVDGSLLGRSYSDCMPSSNVRFGYGARKCPYTPPVGKLRERIISKSAGASSGKHVVLNPELTCFRIDENTSTSEDNDNLDELGDSIKKGTGSREKDISAGQEASVNMTSKCCNPTTFVAAGKFLNKDSLDSMNNESNLCKTQTGVKQKLENGYGIDRRYKNDDKENRSPSIGANGAQKAPELSQNRFSRQKLSRKASQKNGSQTFLDMGCKRNNIVSNISSFVPLVQQKQQAAAILTGKRDIKVKSLEVAEAAKRLEEKRENERKIRKEAAKLERERIEKENIRQLELKQKEKEEERKKKGDMAARKRQREEEERKEKERKRKCVEEARRQQREQEIKLRAEKEEKEQQRKAAERKRKELAGEANKRRKIEKGRGGAGSKKGTEMGLRTDKVVTGDDRHASCVIEDSESFKEPHVIAKVVNDLKNFDKGNEHAILVVEESQVQSYEMSPYQDSDDEDEEEDDTAKRKFIPSWARQDNLSISLASQKHIDPTQIFLRARCPEISEVILSRKQRL